MERLLQLWDELDDFACAARHLARVTVEEVASLEAPLAAAASALGAGLLGLAIHLHFLLASGLAHSLIA